MGTPGRDHWRVILDLGVVAGGSSRSLFQPLVLFVAAVVLLDENRGPSALLETLLLVVGPELGLDQDGSLGHLLIQSVLRGQRRTVIGRAQDPQLSVHRFWYLWLTSSAGLETSWPKLQPRP